MGLLHQLLRLYPRTVAKKAARRRNLRPVRPSRKVELWYRDALRRQVVEQCRRAGDDVAAGLRAHWPGAHDSVAPGLDALLALAASRFGDIHAIADRLARLAAAKSLGSVDEELAKNIRKAIGIDISSYLERGSTVAEALNVATAANVELIVSIPAQYLEKVRVATEASFAAGERWEVLAKKISHVGDVTDQRARLIARDQTSKMNAAFNQVRQTGLGIARYTWSTARDERVRRSHGALNGTTQKWNDPPTVDGEPAHPGHPINCRCVPLPLLDLVEEPAPTGGALQQEAA